MKNLLSPCAIEILFILCTDRIDVLNKAIVGACRTAAAKLFQMGIVCGIS